MVPMEPIGTAAPRRLFGAPAFALFASLREGFSFDLICQEWHVQWRQ